MQMLFSFFSCITREGFHGPGIGLPVLSINLVQLSGLVVLLRKSEQKEKHFEELNKMKIFSAVNNDFEFNAGAGKANITIIEDNPEKIHLHLLKTGFRDVINLNIPFKERSIDEINSLEIIAITTDYVNREILARENLLVYIQTRV